MVLLFSQSPYTSYRATVARSEKCLVEQLLDVLDMLIIYESGAEYQ